MDLFQLVHQVRISKLSLIQEVVIYGFHQNNVGYHSHVGLIIITLLRNHQHIKLMELNGQFNMEVELLKDFGHMIQSTSEELMSLMFNLVKLQHYKVSHSLLLNLMVS